LKQPHPALQNISQGEWTEITLRLTAYAQRYFSIHYGHEDVILPRGYSASDIAQQIVLKVLEGTRKWDPDQGDLLDYMVRQVRSLTNHCLRSWSGKSEVSIEVEDEEELTAEEIIEFLAIPEAKKDNVELLSTEDILLEKEVVIERNALIDVILDVSRDDPELESFVLAFLDSPDTRRRIIAETMGKTPDEVTNLIKRLRRKAIEAVKSRQK